MLKNSVPKGVPAWFAGIAGLYFLLWVFLPPLLAASYPLDVTEGIYWGHEWQWGYYKHPPLSSWVLYSFHRLFGMVGPFLLSQIAVAVTLYLIYALGKKLLGRQKALLACAFQMGVFYFTWPTLEFNHNVAQLPVWAGLVYFLYRALETRQLRWWVGFGLLAGLGMLVKYSVALLLIVAVLYSLHPDLRRSWKSPGPWLALALAVLCFLPNVLWLIRHDWLPFVYTQSRAAEAEQHSGGRWGALGFMFTQLFCHLPLVLILLAGRVRFQLPIWNRQLRFAAVMGLGPAVLLALLGLVFGIGLKDMWGMPMWNLSGVLIAACIPDKIANECCLKCYRGVAVWLVMATALMAVYLQWGAQLRHKPARTDWPQTELAQAAQDTWDRLSSCPLDNVSGDRWIAGLIATHSVPQPSVVIGSDSRFSPWINPQRLMERGSLMVWQAGSKYDVPQVESLAAAEGMTRKNGIWQLPWHKLSPQKTLAVEWQAYIPNRCVK